MLICQRARAACNFNFNEHARRGAAGPLNYGRRSCQCALPVCVVDAAAAVPALDTKAARRPGGAALE